MILTIKEFNNLKLLNYLKSNIKKFDKAVVCDFSHGLINDEVIKFLKKNQNFFV